MDSEERQEQGARFELCVTLADLLSDFMSAHAQSEQLNQPTILDFAEYVSSEVERLGTELGLDEDETQPA